MSPVRTEKRQRLGRVVGFIVPKNWTIWFQRLVVGRERAYNCSKHQLNRCVHNRQKGYSQQLPSCRRRRSEEKVLCYSTESLRHTPLAPQYCTWYQRFLLWKKRDQRHTATRRWKAKENKKKKSTLQTPS